MIPPSVDTTVAMHQERAKMPFTLIPRESATCWLSAVARIAIPVKLYLKNREKAASKMTAITKLHRWTGETGTGPRWKGTEENSAGNGRVSLPQTILRTPRITLAKPNVTMMTEIRGCPIRGRKTPRSMIRPRAIDITSVRGKAR
jgi:hypothetical protein